MSAPAENLEIEIKLQLQSFAEYLKLLGFVGNAEREEQNDNCFFDSADNQLARAGYAYRVRLRPDSALVTVKGMPSSDGAAVIREEIEESISRSVAQAIQREERDCLDVDIVPADFVRKTCPGIKMKKLVEFVTLRKYVQFRLGDDRCLLQIDKSDYSDGSTDYELEVEVLGREQIPVTENCLKRLFDSLDIPLIRQTDSKLVRALNRISSR